MSVVPRIVVLGGGFAGLTLCTKLDALAAEGRAQVTLVERTPSMGVGGLNQFVLKRQVHASDVPMQYGGGAALRCSNDWWEAPSQETTGSSGDSATPSTSTG